MKNRTKNAFLVLSLVCVSSQSFADNNDRVRNQIRERYRGIHKKMDICAEVKADLAAVENEFFTMETKVRNVNDKIEVQRSKVTSKTSKLNTVESEHTRASNLHNDLVRKKQNRPKLEKTLNQLITDLGPQIATASTVLEAAKKREKKKCPFRFSCSDAKKDRKKKEKAYNNLVNKKAQAKKTLAELRTIDQRVARAKKALTVATKNLNQEKNAIPTLSQLETKLTQMINKRDRDFKDYDKLERQYGRLEIRTEKCMDMQFEARKAPVFKSALLTFAADNGQGCEEYTSMLYSAKSPAQKQGLREAYELICESQVLERRVEVPVEVPVRVEVPVEVPGQCPELPPVITPICDEDNGDDNGSYEPQYVEEIIRDFYSTNNGAATYPARIRDGRNVPTIVKEISDRGAVAIKLDIAKIDLEAGYDFMIIKDENGNIVYDQSGYASQEAGKEGRITNQTGDRALTNFTTGWVPGSKLTILLHTDGATERTGFEFDSYQVRYER